MAGVKGMKGGGGRRVGAGRSAGAKDFIVRMPRREEDRPRTLGEQLIWLEQREAWAKIEIGRLRSENEDLRRQLNQGTSTFLGDSKQFLDATMRGDYFPSAVQLMAAREMARIEYAHPKQGQDDADLRAFDRPEYTAMMAAITEALIPFPDARRAVAEALRKLDASQYPPLVINAQRAE